MSPADQGVSIVFVGKWEHDVRRAMDRMETAMANGASPLLRSDAIAQTVKITSDRGVQRNTWDGVQEAERQTFIESLRTKKAEKRLHESRLEADVAKGCIRRLEEEIEGLREQLKDEKEASLKNQDLLENTWVQVSQNAVVGVWAVSLSKY